MNEQPPDWTGGFITVHENGRWTVPFYGTGMAQVGLDRLQRGTDIRLRLIRNSNDPADWSVVEA